MTTDFFTITHLDEGDDRHAQLVADVRDGLGARPYTLAPKYFYDTRGSVLFEDITRLPEYYQTRTETAILEQVADDVVVAVEPTELVELGSGSSRKTRLLIEAMGRHGAGAYVPFDVSEAALREAADTLRADYPWLAVRGYVGDFERHLRDLPDAEGPRLVAFLGSTIGNLEPDERVRFLKDAAVLLDGGGALLLGIDLVKDVAVLEAAYDDAAGVTAAFNRNVLAVLNRELGGDFPLDDFVHVARWVPDGQRMEMRLRATRAVTVSLPGAGIEVPIVDGDEIHTEISCKFTRDGAAAMLADAGFVIDRWDTDEREWFALVTARPGGA